MALWSPLSLLSLPRSTRLTLRPRTLRKPGRAGAVESTRLCGCTSATLWASRATGTHTADVLSASALGVWLERCLWRCGSSPRAKPLLVLRI